MLGVLLMSVLMSVRLDVLFSYFSNDMYSSVQTAVEGMAAHDSVVKQSGVHGFYVSMGIFSVLAVVFIARYVARHLSDCSGSSFRGACG